MTGSRSVHKIWNQALGLLTQARRKAYRAKVFSQVQLTSKVLSIGNLTVGGSGKTPVTAWLAQRMLREKRKICLVSRSYKADLKTALRLDTLKGGGSEELDASDALAYGDEAVLLAQSLPEVPVFVGPSKSQTALFADQSAGPFDLVLVDDGFQHLRLKRDVDLVLVDATDQKAVDLFPLGRAREPLSALSEASLILLTKTNWASEENLVTLRNILPKNIPVFEAQFLTVWPQLEKGVRIGVFAGLAQTGLFVDQVKKKYFGQTAREWMFADHYRYQESDLQEFAKFLGEDSRNVLLTTEKDFVKIPRNHPLKQQVKIVRVQVEMKEQEEHFVEKLWTLLR